MSVLVKTPRRWLRMLELVCTCVDALNLTLKAHHQRNCVERTNQTLCIELSSSHPARLDRTCRKRDKEIHRQLAAPKQVCFLLAHLQHSHPKGFRDVRAIEYIQRLTLIHVGSRRHSICGHGDPSFRYQLSQCILECDTVIDGPPPYEQHTDR